MPLKHWEDPTIIVAGADEAGRGCLAGPVTAAAVILPADYHNPMLNDSKQLTVHQRDILRVEIEREAVSWAVTHISPQRIDEINILWASVEGMQQSVGKLSVTPELLLIDGNRFRPYKNIPHRCIVKGDATYYSIAAASVLAKTHRDELICTLSKEYPFYGWEKNKGYPTKEHREGIKTHGVTPWHRLTFRLSDNQTDIYFDGAKGI
ncbi:MAG: ribonuclease HII [Flavobacteriales bacterium]|nr:ribonuclease HII [Flavobacteriales bacterium]